MESLFLEALLTMLLKHIYRLMSGGNGQVGRRLEGLTMNKISKAMRERVIEALDLIASEESQRKYQNEVPDVDVSAELFNQWEDCFFPSDATFRDGFNFDELQALMCFDKILNEVSEETPRALPAIDEFIVMPAWRKLADAAHAALKIVNNDDQLMAANGRTAQ